ncbi:serine/arginine-rich splicing factor SC35-like [Hibiscus syriacus]|uniref:serine/arginine-rich splicing factor SC35-like n=1 Tax=Hibiscus syriacus TaxID=106335 RepID=UPI001922747E|nr:serine/arginine-rich splicing factor SC35-like [Hibiscus syriacus]
MSEKSRERKRAGAFGRSFSGEEWTVFVGNLSKRVTRSELREIFNHYGRIVRVFIPSFMVKTNYKSSTFAFVQYAVEEGCRRAVMNVNGTLIDGKRVTVGVAKYKRGRKRDAEVKRSQLEGIKPFREANGRQQVDLESPRSLRDGRTYKEVVNVDKSRSVDQQRRVNREGQKKAKGVRNVWDMHIPSEDF